MQQTAEQLKQTKAQFDRITAKRKNADAHEHGQIAIALSEHDARENVRNGMAPWRWNRFNAERALSNHGPNLQVERYRALEKRIREKGPRIPNFAHKRGDRSQAAHELVD